MKKIRKIASFLRWRLVPVRYLTMLLSIHWNYLFKSYPIRTSISQNLIDTGYYTTKSLNHETIKEILAIYHPRTTSIIPKKHGHPFINLFTREDFTSDNPVFRLAFSPKILEVASDYFGNKLILDSIQVLFSYASNGEIRESQHWHLDYGDKKSFHAIVYLNDVYNKNDGPFTFVNNKTTQKIGRSVIIQRIPDNQFNKKVSSDEIIQFLGPAGSMLYVDPATCYHYGSRCEESRLAIFVTFSSWFPYAQPTSLITENREKILTSAKKVRPDLNEKFLKTMLQLP